MVVALAGGTLLLLTGILSPSEVFQGYIDWNTIALLFSMMVLIQITEKTGFFTFIAISFAQKVHGKPIPLLIGISMLTALGSAFLDNVTTVLIFVPIVLKITFQLNLPSFPYLIVIIFSSNIGGSTTLIGDPPNIMIGQAVDELNLLSFLNHLAPVAVIMFIVMLGVILVYYKTLLLQNQSNKEELMLIDASSY